MLTPRDQTVGFLLIWLLQIAVYAAYAIWRWAGTSAKATVSEVVGERLHAEPVACTLAISGVALMLVGLVVHFINAGSE